ncbi:hypothetical protein [Pseudomonas promysalinigenes]|uniref:Uncharacterized protein n=1 Tax=Pseudomonas promysalinigenes TaxID=485898 RepID=A0ABY6AQ81_9PSED|nr:hypothetical protein [Pseudomonas promysalinigenes]UXH41310.1 hypothetical protein N5C08_07155 [Pseudomonas promysalinigenes]
MEKNIEATIVGASDELNLDAIQLESDIYALNSAYFHLVDQNIIPSALITGDKRFVARAGISKMATVNRLITFLDADPDVNRKHAENFQNIELFRCLGRDGFSSDSKEGFYHGCSSFFFAVQYLVSTGYKTINTHGVNFPPPEKYKRLNGVNGHPEFVYDIQLKNLAKLKSFLMTTNTKINCGDLDSNLNIFI